MGDARFALIFSYSCSFSFISDQILNGIPRARKTASPGSRDPPGACWWGWLGSTQGGGDGVDIVDTGLRLSFI